MSRAGQLSRRGLHLTCMSASSWQPMSVGQEKQPRYYTEKIKSISFLNSEFDIPTLAKIPRGNQSGGLAGPSGGWIRKLMSLFTALATGARLEAVGEGRKKIWTILPTRSCPVLCRTAFQKVRLWVMRVGDDIGIHRINASARQIKTSPNACPSSLPATPASLSTGAEPKPKSSLRACPERRAECGGLGA